MTYLLEDGKIRPKINIVLYISQNEFDRIYEQVKRVGKLSNGFIKYLRQKTG